jgi:hypothetical protein
VAVACGVVAACAAARVNLASSPSAVHPLFDLSTPAGSPFPSDRFTVQDSSQNTGRRVNLPLPPDCAANRSDCDDLSVVNQLDGFHQHPRISIPFDGEIDLTTVTAQTVFIISVPEFEPDDPLQVRTEACDSLTLEDSSTLTAAPLNAGGPTVRVIPINQIVWDPATDTLHARAGEALDEHTRYALVVTRTVRGANGIPLESAPEFRNYRQLLGCSPAPELRWFKQQLLDGEHAARIAGVARRDLAVITLFHTQSSTYLMQQLHDAVFAAPPPALADFNIGPGGSRAVFNFADVTSVTFNRQMTTGPALSPTAGNLNEPRVVPGAIGRIAFGRYVAPDFRTHPGEYVAPIASRTGVAVSTGSETIYFNVYLPSGQPPAGGWPLAIVGHGANNHKNFLVGTVPPFPPAHGVAVVCINQASHGFGPLSTLTIAFNNAPSVTIPAGGRSIDQNGDGAIELTEGFRAAGAYAVRDQYDGYVQTSADMMQLVRVLQAGMDVDGDGLADLDGARITYWGHSNGSNYGMALFTATPEFNAAVFSGSGSPVLEHRRLSPIGREQVGQMLAGRTPSLLNSAYGITHIDGVAMPPPFFNENQPLRGQPPLINTVPGAIAIQQVFERYAWAGRYGDAAAHAPRVGTRPVLIHWGRGDQRGANPTTSEVLRAGGLLDRSIFFRFDLFYPTLDPAFRSQAFVTQGHWWFNALNPVPLRPLVSAVQDQTAQFLASGGAAIPPIAMPQYFEQPSARLRDDLGYITP